jgi:putative membrane protein
LPFQLYNYLDWVTIPGTMLAAYIILGLSKMYVLFYFSHVA